jgi:hypothetical protein
VSGPRERLFLLIEDAMKLVTGLFLFALAAGPLAAHAADQTEHLRKVPKVLEDPDIYVNSADGTASFLKIRGLIAREFPNDFNDPGFYCIVHVLRWGETPDKVEKSSWYVYRSELAGYRGAGRWTEEKFRAARIYGSHKVGVLYVHVNVPLARDTEELRNRAATGAITREVVDSATPRDGGAITATSTRGFKLNRIGDYLVELDYTAIEYQIDVTAKLPAPIENLKSVVGLLQSAGGNQVRVALAKGALYASDLFGIVPVPSDISVTGKAKIDTTGDTTELGTHAFDNEGLYNFDFSIGVPLKSYKDLKEDAATQTLQPKAITRDNLLALVNIYLRPVDTKNARALRINPVVGVAVAKRPLDTLVAGASIGLVQVQFLAAYKWVKPELKAGEELDTQPKRIGSWTFGVNIPVKTVVAQLKK